MARRRPLRTARDWYSPPAVISANCPSCGSVVNFAHAASVTTVCRTCQSSVYRQGQSLTDLGKISSFERDLSPLQLDARGFARGRYFTLVGVVRKGRPGVRWNEWFCAFEDGSYGWLSDGNGEFQLFEHEPRAGRLPAPKDLPAGSKVVLGDTTWVVTEVGTASVLSAEGELPFAVRPGEPLVYCDLKTRDGRAGTLDLDDAGAAQLWCGVSVELPKLQMTGCKSFTGWSDPALTGFRGPDVEAVRALTCPKCNGPVTLHAPGSVQSYTCRYCGSRLGANEGGGGLVLALLKASSNPPFTPAIPLGSRGTLGGVEWAIIGAQVRAVRADGMDWSWTEFLLHNPWRGFAFLVRDTEGHFSLVRKIPDLPDAATMTARWRGTTYKGFAAGVAETKAVLGEFWWQVKKGDRAITRDFVAPPRMLSEEREGKEVTWSVAEWLSPDDVSVAFGHPVPPPSGVAPNQPNPYEATATRRFGDFGGAALAVAVVLAWVAGMVLSPTTSVHQQAWRVSLPDAGGVWVSDPFDVDGRVTIEARTPITQREGTVHVALLNLDDGSAVLPWAKRRRDGKLTKITAAAGKPKPGRYLARVELATPEGDGAGVVGEVVEIDVRTGGVWGTAGLVGLFAAVLFWVARFVLRGAFESRRWSNADLGGFVVPGSRDRTVSGYGS